MRLTRLVCTVFLSTALLLTAVAARGEALPPYHQDGYVADASPARGVALPRPHATPARQQAGSYAGPAPIAFSSTVQSMLNAVSPSLLMHHVCKLQDSDALPYCNELGTRYSYATANLDEAAHYLYNQLAALGLSVAYDAFEFDGKPLANLVAELPGSGPESKHVYILCAHYDSISNVPYSTAPGADDNASGCAAVLEAARLLSQHRFPRTLRFVLFAGEEQGFLGSAHYATQAYLRGDSIDGVINLDMIGYESVPPNDHIVEVHAGTDSASVALADAFLGSITEYGLLLVPQKLTSDATSRSDHSSFWNFGYPAILGIEDFQDFSPYYHKTSDTLAHMQTSLMVEFTKASIATLAELASVTLGPRVYLHLPIVVR